MRSLLFFVMGPLVVLVAGCGAERDAWDPIEPGSIARENARAGTIRCAADEGGNLHVQAPADARVTTPASESDDAVMQIEYGSADPDAYQMPRPPRPRSRSLGFIGDAPLTQGPNHGGRHSYGAHDDLIGPHRHNATSGWWHGSVFGGGRRGYRR